MDPTFPSPQGLLLDALEKRWKTCLTELDHCQAEFSNEAVHDVRVALRRLLSLASLLHTIEPHPRLKKLRRALKSQLDNFDELRDTQVMLVKVAETINELPQLGDFQAHLLKAERRLLKKLQKKIEKFELKDVTRRILKTRESLEAEEKADLAASILQSVDEAFAIARQRRERIDPARPATIHRLRVAFKKFRYMVEIASPLLAGIPERNLKRMNHYQTLMGEIQDAEVFQQSLAEFDASSADLEPVRLYSESRHADAISAYMKNKDMLDTFWRSAAQRPFPWENTE